MHELGLMFATPVATYSVTTIINKINQYLSGNNISKEQEQLFIQLKQTLEYHQTLVEQLEDSEFIRKRNLSLWLYDKLHEIKISTSGKPLYQILLSYLFKSNAQFADEEFQLEFFAYFKKYIFEYLKHGLIGDTIDITANKSFKKRMLYAQAFQKLQKSEYINELSADTLERKEFIISILQKFQKFYDD